MGAQPVILGAAGFLGVNLVDAMLARDISPRCLHRATTNTLPLRRRKVDRVVADVNDRASLVQAFAGARVVFHLAAHYPRDARTPDASIERALGELEQVLEAAAQAQVERLVFVSSTASVAPVTGRLAVEADTFAEGLSRTTLLELGVYHAVKILMEQRVRKETRFQTVIACPGACIGPWDLRVGTSALMVATANHRDPPHPDGWVNFVDVRDVAEGLIALGAIEAPPDRVLMSGHPLRAHDFLVHLAKRYGAPAPSAPLSAEAAAAFADAEEERVHGTAERAMIAREIVDLIIHGQPIEAARFRALLGRPVTSLADTLDAFDAFARRLRFIPTLVA